MELNKAVYRQTTIACIFTDDAVDFTDRTSTGTKTPYTSWKAMSRYQLTLLDKSTANAFEQICWPMMEHIRANIEETRTVAQTRHLLLPKLMSGEIRHREAENVMEDVA